MMTIGVFLNKLYFTLYLFTLLMLSLFDSTNSLFYCKCNDHNKCRTVKSLSSDSFCVIQDKGHCYSARIIQVDPNTKPISAKISNRFGCLSTTTKSFLNCKGHYVNLTSPVAIDCCNKTHYCNSDLHPTFHHHKSDQDAMKHAVIMYSRGKETTTSYNNNNNQFPTNITFLLTSFVILFICLCIFIVLIFFYRKKLKWHIRASKQMLRQTPNNIMSIHSRPENMKLEDCGETALLTNNNKTATGSLMTSSSMITNSTSVPLTGLSHQKLSQRTVGHHVLFREFLGKGRFSKVWAGEWLGEMVTVKCLIGSNHVKIFDEILWLRTIRLYYSCPLRHNGIVSLLGSDKISVSNHSELFGGEQYQQDLMTAGCDVRPILIYPYFHWGTLARLMATSHWDLSLNSESKQVETGAMDSRMKTLTRMAFSLVSGLCYLHTEIAATKGKPAMAHRNLKSSNVYVKDDYSCCIGDLEWALVSDSKPCERAGLDSQILTQLTTPNGLVRVSDFDFYVSNVLLPTECRYVAPELLESIDSSYPLMQPLRTVDDYKKSDVYSLSLILWELLVWFEPRLKCPTYQSRSSEAIASESIITWIYEPAYQSELIQSRKSNMFDLAQYYDEPRSSEMRFLVLDQSVRPLINYQNTSDQCSSSLSSSDPNLSSIGIVDLLCQVIPQCWCSSPNSRLTSLKIKKYISQFQESLATSSEDV